MHNHNCTEEKKNLSSIMKSEHEVYAIWYACRTGSQSKISSISALNVDIFCALT